MVCLFYANCPPVSISLLLSSKKIFSHACVQKFTKISNKFGENVFSPEVRGLLEDVSWSKIPPLPPNVGGSLP